MGVPGREWSWAGGPAQRPKAVFARNRRIAQAGPNALQCFEETTRRLAAEADQESIGVFGLEQPPPSPIADGSKTFTFQAHLRIGMDSDTFFRRLKFRRARGFRQMPALTDAVLSARNDPPSKPRRPVALYSGVRGS